MTGTRTRRGDGERPRVLAPSSASLMPRVCWRCGAGTTCSATLASIVQTLTGAAPPSLPSP